MIVQMIPAEEWFSCSRYQDEDEESLRPLVAWAIDDEGIIFGLVADFDHVLPAERFARDCGDTWLGYVHRRDTPEGRERTERLNSAIALLDPQPTPTPLRGV